MEEEDEMYVYVDLGEIEHLNLNTKDIVKLIAIESEHPILQIGNRHYRGEHDFALGTYVLLENDETVNNTIKPVSKEIPKNRLKYVTKTDKVIKMKRIFLREKNFSPCDTESTDTLPATTEEAMQQLCQAIEESPSGKTDL